MAPKVGEKAVKAPAKKAPAAKKVVKKTTGAGKKKSKSVESYKIYIYKVLKQVGTRLLLNSLFECTFLWHISTQCGWKQSGNIPIHSTVLLFESAK